MSEEPQESGAVDPTPLVLLHAEGQAPMAWEDVVVSLYGSRRLLTPWVPGLRPTEKQVVPLADSAAALDQQLMLEGMQQVDLCGLSYGAMVATRLAADFPERVRRLVLIGGQVRPPRMALRVQGAALKLMPASRLAEAGVSKERLLQAMEVTRAADLTDALPQVQAPTLVLVGAKDKTSQPGARALADGIPGARLRIVDGAGHALNEVAPAALVDLLRDFLDT
ncbi:Beta-ketoadipate enol-lactone hydrolase [Serinicoccus hydrothermalis]|uniref:Beta-ketoadipate enol-lactone hydrolase n=1 Tax=Serinicoccus hydrothermalis TaxID=1758689 RepID=A0A1B1NC38_9MICO|nr:alpha/beta fold hydrolase [Serinicoccus hydrothermalis]ANS78992.1 Beta-ketoadipate enol-lactone hydrolase [Serinicoccus hydrothermalis]